MGDFLDREVRGAQGAAQLVVREEGELEVDPDTTHLTRPAILGSFVDSE